MAVFPALTPSSRTFTPGQYPYALTAGLSGNESRVRESAAMTSSQLRLAFSAITEAQMLSILSHYQGQLGAFYAFSLPADLWSGMATASAFTLTDYSWRYAEPPSVSDLPCGNHNVDIELVSVTPESSVADGLRLIVTASLAAGAAGAASGFDQTVTATLEYGAYYATGLNETVTITLAAGTAGGGAETIPAFFDVGAQLTPGAAAAANGLEKIVTATLSTSGATGGTGNIASSVLLHFDGTNNSTTFIDSSANALAFTASGNAKISTAQSKFGGASGLFDGSGDYIGASYASPIDLIGYDFTVEAWVYAATSKSDGMRIAAAGGGAVAWNSTNGIHWLFQLYGNSPNTVLQIQTYKSGGNQILSSSVKVSLSTWTHVCACISGTTAYVGVGGTVASTSISTPIRPSTNPRLEIATIPGENGSSAYAFNGYIDEFRIVKGQALYTANYSAPSAPF